MSDLAAGGIYRRGIASLALLALLRQKDMYGYQLVQELEAQSGGSIKIQEGSLYPVLYKLLDQGYISDKKVQTGKRMTRVYYHLEPAGEAYFQALLSEFQAVNNGVLRIVEGRAVVNGDN